MTITITTTGRTSGIARPATLYAFEDGDRLVIVGSRGGAAHDPAWVGNLRAEPRATVRVGRQTREMRALEVGPEDRERLWALVTAAFPLYETYRRRTKRTIPLFVLVPDEDRP
jgi:deazaflavin-dependent oxidoreductase (nitroreductase family)